MTTTVPGGIYVSGDGHFGSVLALDDPDAATSTGRWSATAELLGVSVICLSSDACVLAVDGEVDMASAPQLDAAVRHQLSAPVGTTSQHLIMDLEQVRFMGCAGLSCLLEARVLAGHRGWQLHLSGMCTRAVALPLDATGLRVLFNTYSTLAHALDEVAARTSCSRRGAG